MAGIYVAKSIPWKWNCHAERRKESLKLKPSKGAEGWMCHTIFWLIWLLFINCARDRACPGSTNKLLQLWKGGFRRFCWIEWMWIGEWICGSLVNKLGIFNPVLNGVVQDWYILYTDTSCAVTPVSKLFHLWLQHLGMTALHIGFSKVAALWDAGAAKGGQGMDQNLGSSGEDHKSCSLLVLTIQFLGYTILTHINICVWQAFDEMCQVWWILTWTDHRILFRRFSLKVVPFALFHSLVFRMYFWWFHCTQLSLDSLLKDVVVLIFGGATDVNRQLSKQEEQTFAWLLLLFEKSTEKVCVEWKAKPGKVRRFKRIGGCLLWVCLKIGYPKIQCDWSSFSLWNCHCGVSPSHLHFAFVNWSILSVQDLLLSQLPRAESFFPKKNTVLKHHSV